MITSSFFLCWNRADACVPPPSWRTIPPWPDHSGKRNYSAFYPAQRWLPYVLVRQGEIEYVEVLDHAIIVGGLGDHHNAPLDVPAQHDLGGGFPALRANGGKQ